MKIRIKNPDAIHEVDYYKRIYWNRNSLLFKLQLEVFSSTVYANLSLQLFNIAAGAQKTWFPLSSLRVRRYFSDPITRVQYMRRTNVTHLLHYIL